MPWMRLVKTALLVLTITGLASALRLLSSTELSTSATSSGRTSRLFLWKLQEHRHRSRQLVRVSLLGLGGGGRSGAPNSRSDAMVSKVKIALGNNAAFKARTDQYTRGAITAADLVRYLDKDVATKVLGCDLEDVVTAALERIPDARKRDLLSKASRGRAIGPGGAVLPSGLSRGASDVIVKGRRRQYAMNQKGQRVSSGKSTIYNGIEVGKEGVLLKLKVITKSNASLAAAEMANLERIKAKNGAGASSRHFLGMKEFIENYNGRGDTVMVMQSGSMDLRKFAELNGGGSFTTAKIREYASEMASVMRCIHKAGLVWTDLKLDNMVLCGRMGKEVRAIDLEAAVPARSAPKSFTPEATPPDFVVATRSGYAGVTVDRSFDVWSLGMAILHLYLGRGYFQGSNPPQTLAALGQQGFAVDLSGVRDSRIRGLLTGLLDPDPQKRLQYFDSPLGRLAFYL